MKAPLVISLLCMVSAPHSGLLRAEALRTNTFASLAEDVQFSQSAPYASTVALMRHLGYSGTAPPYDIAHERFRVILPPDYSTNTAWGLLVWVSPGEDARVDANWEPVLARHRLICVAAYQSGNTREAIDRCRLALDATCNICRRYRIDPRRIYVAGFSGGARMASILGVAYADVFTGTLSICGVDFYQNVPAAAGGSYPATYRPDSAVLLLAKTRGRFVLLTGEKDVNRDNTKSTLENGFKKNGFKSALYLEVAGMSHAIPGAAVLNTALGYLTGPAPASGALPLELQRTTDSVCRLRASKP